MRKGSVAYFISETGLFIEGTITNACLRRNDAVGKSSAGFGSSLKRLKVAELLRRPI